MLGMIFTLMAAFFWVLFWNLRRSKEPMGKHIVFLWLAGFYTLLLFLPSIKDHKIALIFWSAEPDVGVIFGGITVVLWISYFFQRWRARRIQP